jgi:hypothetical protein
MPKSVLQMVALGLEDMVVFVVDLPASSARLRPLRDVVRTQAMIGDTAVVRELCTGLGMPARELAPIDRPGIVTPSQQHLMAVPRHQHCRAAAMPTTACKLGHPVVGLPKRQPLLECDRGVGLAHPEAVTALLSGQGTQGLCAVESIAQPGHLRRRPGLGMRGPPPFARRLCAVLCVRPVLRHAVLGGQGEDRGASWAHDDGGDGRVIREGGAVREWTGETVVALDGLRGTVIGPIECDQPLIPKDAKGVQHMMQDGTVVYRVRVRRKGYPQQVASFPKLSDAKKWAQIREGAVLEGYPFSQ